MIEYILNNKEWLFSGIGVFLMSAIGSKLLKRQKEEVFITTNDNSAELSLSEENQQNQTLEEETEVQKISKRFCVVLELMNENRNYSKFTIPQLAQIMKLHKVSELENVFTGKEEPAFQFIDHFCEAFGINKKWLTEGKESPFSNRDQTKYDPLYYFEDIANIDPKGIYFIRANTDTAQTFILIKISDWKYKIFHRTWHISDHVGAGGQSQLFSFYKLIKKLRDEEGYYLRCGGLTLDKNNFNALFSGEEFPGKYIDIGRMEDPWWDDLTDINHTYPIAENYEYWHGTSFIKAQEIIKSKLRYEETRKNC